MEPSTQTGRRMLPAGIALAGTTQPSRSYLKTSALLLGAGLPGIVSLLPVLPSIEDVPRAALLLNPLLLLAAMSFSGSWAATRCGFSLVRGDSVRSAPAVLLLGALVGAAMATVDHLTYAFWSAGTNLPSMTSDWGPAALMAGILYGGVTEEIVMRWGLMSLVAVAAQRLAGRRGAPVARGPVVAGAVISSLLFAVGHLPTMAILGELTPPVVVRTLVLNMAAGMLFARVFVRHSLVSATVCHAGFHLGVGVVALFSA